MQCYVCGTLFEDGLENCPVCGTVMPMQGELCYNGMPPLEVELPPQEPAPQQKYQRRKPHIALRIGMQFLSFVLCMMLCVSLVATVLIADLHVLTSAGGIKKIITAALMPSRAPYAASAVVGAAGVRLNESQPSGSGENNAVMDMLYNTLQEMLGEDVNVDRSKLEEFVENSTVADFIAEKTAGLAEDIINGTEETQITAEDMIRLVEENKAAIEQSFGVTITEEQMTQIRDNMAQVMEQQDLTNKIRTEINKTIESATESAAGAGIPLAEILDVIRLLTQDAVLYGAIGLCVLLIALLCGANFYNVPAGMTWAAVPCILIGLILSAPIAALQFMPDMLGGLGGLAGLVNVFAPIHYAVPIFGVVTLIASIVWRIVRSCIQNGQTVTV